MFVPINSAIYIFGGSHQHPGGAISTGTKLTFNLLADGPNRK